MKIKRAKSIRNIQQKRLKENPNIFGLDMYIDSVYKRYLELCSVIGEKPLSKGKWLFEDIEIYE